VGAAVEQQETTEQADETLEGAYEMARTRLQSPEAEIDRDAGAALPAARSAT